MGLLSSHGSFVALTYSVFGTFMERTSQFSQLIDFLSFDSLLISVLTYDRTEEDDSSLPNLDGSYASRNSVLPPGILPHGMPQVKGDLLQFYIYKILLYFN